MQIFLKDYLPKTESRNNATSGFQSANPQKGTLVSLISVKSQSELDALNVARFIWNAIVDEFNFFEGDILESLKSAIGVADDKLLQLIKNDKESEKSGVELDLALVVFHEDTLYFALYEDQKIDILHENKIVEITEILKKNNVKAGSTNIGRDDIVILSAGDWFEKSRSGLKEKISSKEVIELIAGQSQSLEDGEGLLLASEKDYFSEDLEDTVLETDPVELPKEIEIDKTEKEIEEIPHEEPEAETDEKLQLQHPAETYKERLLIGFSTASARSKALATTLGAHLRTATDKSKLIKKRFSGGRVVNQDKEIPVQQQSSITSSPHKPEAPSRFLSMINTKYGRNPKFKRLMARLSQSKISSASMKGMKIGAYRDSSVRRKRFLTLGAVLGVVLVFMMLVKGVQNYNADKALSEQFATLDGKVTAFLTEAETKLKSDSAAAELALFNAKKSLDGSGIVIDQLNDEEKKRYQELEDQVLVISDKINKTVALTEESGNIELFIDGRIDFGQNSNAGDIAILQNTFMEEHLYITDRGRKSVYKISTQTKEIVPLPGADILESPVYIDVGLEGVYIYDLVKGVVKTPFGDNNAQFESMSAVNGLSPEAFEQASVDDLAIFTINDNVYVLSSEAAAIYKANRTESGSYILPTVYYTEAKLSQAQDFFGDFSIYVLTGGSTGLNRYTYDFSQGRLAPDPVEVTGLKQEFQNLTAGYTGTTLDKGLYLFDTDQKRFILFEKPDPDQNRHPGEMLYLKEYKYRGETEGMFSDVKDIVVDQAEEFMYVLDGNSVWRIKL